MDDKKAFMSLNDDVVVWRNPEDKYEYFTVGDIFRAIEIENTVKSFLAKSEDSTCESETLVALNDFYEKCEALGISPDPCPLCGRYSEHFHSMD